MPTLPRLGLQVAPPPPPSYRLKRIKNVTKLLSCKSGNRKITGEDKVDIPLKC